MKIKIKTKSNPAKPRRPPEISVRPNLAARPICAGPSPQAAPDPNGKTADRPPPQSEAPPARRPWPPNRIEKKNQEQAKTSQNKPKQVKRSGGSAPGAAILGQTKNQALRGQPQTRPRSAGFRHYRACAKAAQPRKPQAPGEPPQGAGGGGTAGRTGKCGEQASARRGIKPAAALLSFPSLATHFHCVPLKPLRRTRAEGRSARPNGRFVAKNATRPQLRSNAPRRIAGRRRAPSDGVCRKAEAGKRKGKRKTENGRREEKRRKKGRNKKTAACRGGYLGVAGSSSAAKIRGALSRRGG